MTTAKDAPEASHAPAAPLISATNYPNAGAYCRQWRRVIEQAKADEGKQPAPTYRRNYGEYKTAAEYAAEYARALQARINTRGTADRQRRGQAPEIEGRKHSQDYQTSQQRDARRVQDITRQRLRVYQFETPEARRRFGHLLASHDD